MPPLKTRFAPSPTGLLHFGNVRTALFNVLLAKREKGTFLLRIEDTDAQRSRAEYVGALQQDLTWLGLEWQEGPMRAKGAGPYFQSQRAAIYEEYLDKLKGESRVYPCFCTAAELEVSRKLMAASGKPPRYNGKCANLRAEEVAAKTRALLPFTLRFRMRKGEIFEFDDLARGKQRFPAEEIGDFIIRRSDGSFSFFYVNALDDALMGVTHVLRGEDHLANTPRQIALLNALKLPVPTYGHISLIVDNLGAPLSKRTGSLSVRELCELGYFPIAVNNYLARLGHNYPQAELLSLEGLAGAFDVNNLGRAPARYDRSQLDYWQAQAVHAAGTGELCEWLYPAVKAWVPEADLSTFTQAVKDNVLFPYDAELWAQAIYAERLVLSPEARQVLESTGPDFYRTCMEVLTEAMDFGIFAGQVKERTGLQGARLFMPLRAAITGQTFGPEMQRVFPLIGYARVKQRITTHLLSNEID